MKKKMVFNNNIQLIILVLSALFCMSSTTKIPSYIHICHRNDPKINECIINSVESLKPLLKVGIPELKVPPIEPLPLNVIRLRSGPNQAQINADLSDVKVWGGSLLKVTDVKTNFKDRITVMKINFPSLTLNANFDVDMNVIILKFKGKGAVSGNLTDYNIDFTQKYDLFKKNDGKDYLRFRKMEVKIYVGKTGLHLDGLFENDPTLGHLVDEVFRDNADIFINEILPALEEGLGDRFREISNEIFNLIPYDELFPE